MIENCFASAVYITLCCIILLFNLNSPPTSERAVSHDGSLSAVSSPMTRSTEAIPENICEQNRLYLASLDYMQVITIPSERV